MKQNNNTELNGIRISLIGGILFSIYGFTFAFITKSQAVLLDGAFDLISFFLVVFSLRIARLLKEPLTEKRPFGYVAFEPFYILIKGTIIFILTIVILISNVHILFRGGNILDLDLITIYILVAIAGNFLIYFLLRQKLKILDSPILAIEKENWLINGLISSGIGIAFLFIQLFQNSFLKPLVPYIDQLIVIAISLITLPIPVKSIRIGLRELLLIAPGETFLSEINTIVNSSLVQPEISDHRIFILKTGRKIWVTIIAKVSAKSIASNYGDKLSKKVSRELTIKHPIHQVDIIISENLSKKII